MHCVDEILLSANGAIYVRAGDVTEPWRERFDGWDIGHFGSRRHLSSASVAACSSFRLGRQKDGRRLARAYDRHRGIARVFHLALSDRSSCRESAMSCCDRYSEMLWAEIRLLWKHERRVVHYAMPYLQVFFSTKGHVALFQISGEPSCSVIIRMEGRYGWRWEA